LHKILKHGVIDLAHAWRSGHEWWLFTMWAHGSHCSDHVTV